ncbi:MAG: transposase domain-containing protein [Cyclonatronaceae bacterium]
MHTTFRLVLKNEDAGTVEAGPDRMVCSMGSKGICKPMVYSFLAISKKHQVDPYQWLRHTLEKINTTKYNEVRSLYPQNLKSIRSS